MIGIFFKSPELGNQLVSPLLKMSVYQKTILKVKGNILWFETNFDPNSKMARRKMCGLELHLVVVQMLTRPETQLVAKLSD